jgi:hypothetical protein
MKLSLLLFLIKAFTVEGASAEQSPIHDHEKYQQGTQKVLSLYICFIDKIMTNYPKHLTSQTKQYD